MRAPRAAVLALVPLLGGCGTLYFGRAMAGGGEVSAADWAAFEREVIAPAFPRGYSTSEARGHWRGADGTAVAEPVVVATFVHEAGRDADAAVRAVVATYRERFHQESVLRERTVTCASF
jgi:hypothetical protein